MKLLIFGAGYSGKAIARLLAPEAEWVVGTTRSAQKMEAIRRAGAEPLVFDGSDVSAELAERAAAATHVVVSAAPGAAGDPVLRHAKTLLASPALEWVGYLSTVGVYGDHQGARVDEESERRPSSARSRERVEAEDAWARWGEENGIPVAILRLSGIYGPGRNAFVNLAKGTARRVIKPGQVFNRIHVADIAGATRHLAAHRLGGAWNVSDDMPSPPQDVITHAAALMGVEPPPEVAFDDIEMTPMARSFWGECKQVSNAKLRASGYDFAYPNYRAALSRMWAEDDWRGEAGSGDGG